jgi:hypothetical protein
MDDYFGRVGKRSRSDKAADAWLFACPVEEDVVPLDDEDSDEADSIEDEDSDDNSCEPLDVVPTVNRNQVPAREALDLGFWVIAWPDGTHTLETLKFLKKTRNRDTKALIRR